MADPLVNGDDLASMSRGISPLDDAGYDPDELRANPQMRAQVMAQLRSPYGLTAGSQGASQPGSSAASAPARPQASAPIAAPAPPRPQTTGVTASQVAPAGAQSNPATNGTAGAGLDSLTLSALQHGMGATEEEEGVAKKLAESDPGTEKLEEQRVADATPTQAYGPDGKLLPQYKPTIGQRIERGLEAFGAGGILGVFDPAIAHATPYGAPNADYQHAEEAREGRLASEDQQLTNAADRFKALTDARKAGREGLGSVVGGYSGVAKDVTTQENADTNKAKNQTQLREHGLTTDDQGNITALPYDQLTPEQQATYDLHQAQTDAADARAALEKSQNDPNSPAYKMALDKLKNAQNNAAAAMERAQAYMGNYLEGAYNRGINGATLPGAPVISNGNGDQTVVGTRNASAATKAQASVAQFNDVDGALNSLEHAARAMVAKGENPDSTLVAGALAQPAGTAGQWLQAHLAKSNLSSEQREYVTSLVAAHENIQALRKSTGGGVSDSQVDRLMQMLPNASTPDLDYVLRQTGQIRATAQRLGKGATTAAGGLSIDGQRPTPPAGGNAQPAAPQGGSVFAEHRRIDQ